MDARSSVHSPDLFLRNTAQLPSTDFVSVSYNLQSASLSPGSLTHMALSPRIVIPNMTMSDSRAAMEDNSNNTTPRRSSSRSIKRRKFDDEIVESSLIKTERGRVKGSNGLLTVNPTLSPSMVSTVSLTTTQSLLHVVEKFVMPSVTNSHNLVSESEQKLPQPSSRNAEKKKVMPLKSALKVTKGHKSSSRRARKYKTLLPSSVKDLGRWKAQDDVMLMTAVQQTNDLRAVFTGVKFSCRFNQREIKERWYALLYNPVVSKLSMQAIKQLHPEVISSIQSRSLFSQSEENELAKLPSTTNPTIETFKEMLTSCPDIFHPMRTAKSLFTHWQLMKQYCLLPDQSVQPIFQGDQVSSFSDMEEQIAAENLNVPSDDDPVNHELRLADKRNKREMTHLEEEIPRWQVIVETVTGINPPEFNSKTFAVLRGRLVRFLMRSREMMLGRATQDHAINADLSLEGPAWKVSRRQAIIKLRNNGDFFITNEGKRSLLVDGKPVLPCTKQKICNNSVLEISCLRFLFLVNQDLISTMRADALKQALTTPMS